MQDALCHAGCPVRCHPQALRRQPGLGRFYPHFGNFWEQISPWERATASRSPQQQGLNITRSERIPWSHPIPGCPPLAFKNIRLSGEAEPEPPGITRIHQDPWTPMYLITGTRGGTAGACSSHHGKGIHLLLMPVPWDPGSPQEMHHEHPTGEEEDG